MNNINIKYPIGAVLKTHAWGKTADAPLWLQIDTICIFLNKDKPTEVLYGTEKFEPLKETDVLEARISSKDIDVYPALIPDPLYKIGDVVELTEDRGYDRIQTISIDVTAKRDGEKTHLIYELQYWLEKTDNFVKQSDINRTIPVGPRGVDPQPNPCGAV